MKQNFSYLILLTLVSIDGSPSYAKIETPGLPCTGARELFPSEPNQVPWYGEWANDFGLEAVPRTAKTLGAGGMLAQSCDPVLAYLGYQIYLGARAGRVLSESRPVGQSFESQVDFLAIGFQAWFNHTAEGPVILHIRPGTNHDVTIGVTHLMTAAQSQLIEQDLSQLKADRASKSPSTNSDVDQAINDAWGPLLDPETYIGIYGFPPPDGDQMSAFLTAKGYAPSYRKFNKATVGQAIQEFMNLYVKWFNDTQSGGLLPVSDAVASTLYSRHLSSNTIYTQTTRSTFYARRFRNRKK